MSQLAWENIRKARGGFRDDPDVQNRGPFVVQGVREGADGNIEIGLCWKHHSDGGLHLREVRAWCNTLINVVWAIDAKIIMEFLGSYILPGFQFAQVAKLPGIQRIESGAITQIMNLGWFEQTTGVDEPIFLVQIEGTVLRGKSRKRSKTTEWVYLSDVLSWKLWVEFFKKYCRSPFYGTWGLNRYVNPIHREVWMHVQAADNKLDGDEDLPDSD